MFIKLAEKVSMVESQQRQNNKTQAPKTPQAPVNQPSETDLQVERQMQIAATGGMTPSVFVNQNLAERINRQLMLQKMNQPVPPQPTTAQVLEQNRAAQGDAIAVQKAQILEQIKQQALASIMPRQTVQDSHQEIYVDPKMLANLEAVVAQVPPKVAKSPKFFSYAMSLHDTTNLQNYQGIQVPQASIINPSEVTTI